MCNSRSKENQLCDNFQVFEETSFDIRSYLKEEDAIELVVREQKIKLYIIVGVPEDAEFSPRTRKEISV